MANIKRTLVDFAVGVASHMWDEVTKGPYFSTERIAQREEEARQLAKEEEDKARYQELLRGYLQDIHQIGHVAKKRKIRAKKSFYGVTLAIGPGGAKLYKGGMLLNEEQEMQLPAKTLSKLRTHFNHLVVPA